MMTDRHGKLGLIAFANDSGLGAQTRRLAHMLKPDKVLIIDTSAFSENKEQHFEWYKDYPTMIAKQFPPSNIDIKKFMEGLIDILTCENPFNFNLVYWAKQQGIKVYCQVNYEFCENLSKPYLPIPDKFLMPSYWKIEDMETRFGKENVMYLPPPIDPVEFEDARQVNLIRTGKPRFLHIVGTVAHLDRNGTLDLLEALKYSKGDFELVIKTQHELPLEYQTKDPRVTYEFSEGSNADLYKNFDALILPRRYGGLSLTTSEALMSGLPVIMSDISPNDKLLPEDWLVEAKRKTYFNSRSLIAVYSTDPKKLAERIDTFIWKRSLPFEIAMDNFSEEVLRPKYLELFNNG